MITGLEDYSRREMLFLANYEYVERLDDLLLRRTLIGWMGQLTMDTLHEIGQIAADALGWDESRIRGHPLPIRGHPLGASLALRLRLPLIQQHGVNLTETSTV